jgi:hypothetical protein
MSGIRGLVYRLGFRPRPGTILYSPTRDLLYAVKGVWPKVITELRKKNY